MGLSSRARSSLTQTTTTMASSSSSTSSSSSSSLFRKYTPQQQNLHHQHIGSSSFSSAPTSGGRARRSTRYTLGHSMTSRHHHHSSEHNTAATRRRQLVYILWGFFVLYVLDRMEFILVHERSHPDQWSSTRLSSQKMQLRHSDRNDGNQTFQEHAQYMAQLEEEEEERLIAEAVEQEAEAEEEQAAQQAAAAAALMDHDDTVEAHQAMMGPEEPDPVDAALAHHFENYQNNNNEKENQESSTGSWRNRYNVVHVVHTRIVPANMESNDLLQYHWELFQAMIWPSLIQQQTTSEFLWLVWVPPNVKTDLRNEMIALLRSAFVDYQKHVLLIRMPSVTKPVTGSPNATVTKVMSKLPSIRHEVIENLEVADVLVGDLTRLWDYHEAARQTLHDTRSPVWPRLVVETQVEHRDAVHRDFVDQLQRAAVQSLRQPQAALEPIPVKIWCSTEAWQWISNVAEIKPASFRPWRKPNATLAATATTKDDLYSMGYWHTLPAEGPGCASTAGWSLAWHSHATDQIEALPTALMDLTAQFMPCEDVRETHCWGSLEELYLQRDADEKSLQQPDLPKPLQSIGRRPKSHAQQQAEFSEAPSLLETAAVARARTPTTILLSDLVPPSSRTLRAWQDRQHEVWEMVADQFGLDPEVLVKLRGRIHGNMPYVVRSIKQAYCPKPGKKTTKQQQKGEFLKEDSKKALRKILSHYQPPLVWSNQYNVVHVIVTPFLLSASTLRVGSQAYSPTSAKLQNLARAKLEQLKTFTVPSIQRQYDRATDFLWIVLVPDKLASDLREALASAVREMPYAVILRHKAVAHQQRMPGANDGLDDDVVANNDIESVQNQDDHLLSNTTSLNSTTTGLDNSTDPTRQRRLGDKKGKKDKKDKKTKGKKGEKKNGGSIMIAPEKTSKALAENVTEHPVKKPSTNPYFVNIRAKEFGSLDDCWVWSGSLDLIHNYHEAAQSRAVLWTSLQIGDSLALPYARYVQEDASRVLKTMVDLVDPAATNQTLSANMTNATTAELVVSNATLAGINQTSHGGLVSNVSPTTWPVAGFGSNITTLGSNLTVPPTSNVSLSSPLGLGGYTMTLGSNSGNQTLSLVNGTSTPSTNTTVTSITTPMPVNISDQASNITSVMEMNRTAVASLLEVAGAVNASSTGNQTRYLNEHRRLTGQPIKSVQAQPSTDPTKGMDSIDNSSEDDMARAGTKTWCARKQLEWGYFDPTSQFSNKGFLSVAQNKNRKCYAMTRGWGPNATIELPPADEADTVIDKAKLPKCDTKKTTTNCWSRIALATSYPYTILHSRTPTVPETNKKDIEVPPDLSDTWLHLQDGLWVKVRDIFGVQSTLVQKMRSFMDGGLEGILRDVLRAKCFEETGGDSTTQECKTENIDVEELLSLYSA